MVEKLVIWYRKRGSRKVTSCKMDTISDMNTWMYWSSLLYERVMKFVFGKSPFGSCVSKLIKKVIFKISTKKQIPDIRPVR